MDKKKRKSNIENNEHEIFRVMGVKQYDNIAVKTKEMTEKQTKKEIFKVCWN